MHPLIRALRSRYTLAGAALVLIGFLTLLALRRPAPLPPAPPVRLGGPAPQLVRIDPGTIVGDRPPKGWTHRIICTTVAIESGDLDVLPTLAAQTAARIRTAMLARVRPPASASSGYTLDCIGIGLSMVCRGENMVVSPDSVDRLHVPMNIVDRFVLGRAEEAAVRGRLSARTPTFALYDASLELAESPRMVHQSIYLRHALLVDPNTGQLRTLLWSVAEKPSLRAAPEFVVEIPPSLTHRSGIHVQAHKILGRIPVAWFFAMTDLPRGVIHPTDSATSSILVSDPTTADESVAMENALRALLHNSPAGTPEWSASDARKPRDSATHN